MDVGQLVLVRTPTLTTDTQTNTDGFLTHGAETDLLLVRFLKSMLTPIHEMKVRCSWSYLFFSFSFFTVNLFHSKSVYIDSTVQADLLFKVQDL